MAKNSFRDPDTHMLKAWGHMETNEPGDLMRAEADNFHERPGEVYWTGSAWAAYTPPGAPDPEGFLEALMAELGVLASNSLLAQYPLAFQAIQLVPYHWEVFEELVIAAHDASVIDDDFYNFIIAQGEAFNLPLDLPALP